MRAVLRGFSDHCPESNSRRQANACRTVAGRLWRASDLRDPVRPYVSHRALARAIGDAACAMRDDIKPMPRPMPNQGAGPRRLESPHLNDGCRTQAHGQCKPCARRQWMAVAPNRIAAKVDATSEDASVNRGVHVLDSKTDVWRRDPESNRAGRICNPLHNRFAIAPLNPSRRRHPLDAQRLKASQFSMH